MAIFAQDSQKLAERRNSMVDRQIAARGVRSKNVLQAMRTVPREKFLPQSSVDRAYDDSPLPIAAGQTISQPYIVALMTEALQLEGGERVLEVGAGSGYAAAVLAEIASEVYTIERHASLAEKAKRTLARVGYENVKVICGDGTLGWPDGAPYDAITVAAGAPVVPETLRQQLKTGGRLVIPVGDRNSHQALLRITRLGKNEFREEHLSDVRFVPLIGEAGWREKTGRGDQQGTQRTSQQALEKLPEEARLIAEAAEPFESIDSAKLDALLERIGDSKVVLIGEASHGTSEFYTMRARITQALIEKKGFNIVAAEADWPDASRINQYVRHLESPEARWQTFARFPTWMWRNREVQAFVDWLHEHNGNVAEQERAGFYGLDLYSLYTSIEAVLEYLDKKDPEAAELAREQYGCLLPWEPDPAAYGRAAASSRYKDCEGEVTAALQDLLKQRIEQANGSKTDRAEFYLDAVQNARLVANAEEYYRTMYSGYSDSWNLRDSHMFETLEALLAHHGPDAKAVVWEHNSHVGNAKGTDMPARGQLNVGQLCRERFGTDVYIIGFGTHTGTVAAADDWGDDMQIKTVRPSLERSWERLCHDTQIPRFMLPLRDPASQDLARLLSKERLERAIGVIYRPQTERASHYFGARLGKQFDEYIWFDESRAVEPLETTEVDNFPDTYPFAI
ncbi:protein-L-isoaspartate(D-aspartate) O-methyltransferase [Allohahella marinimesophila]|uniref:Protein-L-isoaspartate O-methyltransferase n=1 Tax=Allohahella marinimesophila TaxID=1054972 RepID=A0ABP7PTL0_9GAMM